MAKPARPLPRRDPALAEQRLAEAFGDLDDAHGRIQDLTEANQALKLGNRQLAEYLIATVAECDDLSVRSLPYLDTPTWPPATEPVDALLFNELAEELDFLPDMDLTGEPT